MTTVGRNERPSNLDITRKYYGHDAKVCIVNDYVGAEWEYIDHFYRLFYVYQCSRARRMP